MIFDSVYDTYRGVVTYVRVIDGHLSPRERIAMMSTRATHELLEIGVISPEPVPSPGLGVGEVGYLITGVKDVRQSKVGDTVTNASKPASQALGGYQDPKPMVFSGLYPIDGRSTRTSARPSTSSSSTTRRWSTSRRRRRPWASASAAASSACCTSRSCASAWSASSTSTHLDRPQRRLRVTLDSGRAGRRHEPSEFPTIKVADVREPVVRATILAPSEFIGTIMELCQQRRGACAAWTTSPRTASRCGTPCRWPRSSSTSSTS